MIFLFLPIALSAVVGYSVAEHPDEPQLAWKLLGYALLGYLSVKVGALVLPAGFLVSLLMWHRSWFNRRARLVASLLTCLLWVLGFA